MRTQGHELPSSTSKYSPGPNYKGDLEEKLIELEAKLNHGIVGNLD